MKKEKSQAIIIGGILLFSSFFLLPYGYDLTKNKTGALASQFATPQLDYQKPFELHFGSNVLAEDLTALSEGINLRDIIDLGFDYPFGVKFKDEKLLISAEVRNEAGDLVAKITNNSWEVNSDSSIAHDWNFNEYAFEVIDSNSTPVLQVSVQNFNEIYVGGLFYIPSGRLLINSQGMAWNPSDAEIRAGSRPLFKYPSYDLPFAIFVLSSGAFLGTIGTILISWGFSLKEKVSARKRTKKKKRTQSKPKNARTNRERFGCDMPTRGFGFGFGIKLYSNQQVSMEFNANLRWTLCVAPATYQCLLLPLSLGSF